jgi:hypothetical protein
MNVFPSMEEGRFEFEGEQESPEEMEFIDFPTDKESELRGMLDELDHEGIFSKRLASVLVKNIKYCEAPEKRIEQDYGIPAAASWRPGSLEFYDRFFQQKTREAKRHVLLHEFAHGLLAANVISAEDWKFLLEKAKDTIPKSHSPWVKRLLEVRNDSGGIEQLVRTINADRAPENHITVGQYRNNLDQHLLPVEEVAELLTTWLEGEKQYLPEREEFSAIFKKYFSDEGALVIELEEVGVEMMHGLPSEESIIVPPPTPTLSIHEAGKFTGGQLVYPALDKTKPAGAPQSAISYILAPLLGKAH